MPKVYLHYDNSKIGAVTIPLIVDQTTSVSELLDLFAASFNTKVLNSSRSGDSFTLKSSHGKVFSTKKSYDFVELTEDVDDLFVVDNLTPLPVSPQQPAKVVSMGSSVQQSLNASEIKENKSQVLAFMEKRQYKKARTLCERMLSESLPPSEILFVKTIAEINFINKNYNKCITFCKKGLALNKKAPDLLFLQAKALFAKKDFDEVVDITDELKDLVPKSCAANTVKKPVTSSALTASGKKAAPPPSPLPKVVTLLDVLALEAESVFEGGNHNEGANLINKAMAHSGADNYLPVLLAYATFCLRYNKLEDAIRALMKGITVSQTDRRLKSLLYEALKTPAGVTEIQAQLPCSAAAASAYGFMATIVKEHSALQSAISLYRLCLDVEPTSGSYALNLMHTIELTCKYDDAVAVFVSFARNNASTRFNRCIPLIASVLEVLDAAAGGGDVPGSEILGMTYVLDAKNDNHSHIRVKSMGDAAMSLDGEGEVLDLTGDVLDVERIEHLTYSEPEHDLIAMCCTVTKLLYLQGRLSLLPHLFRIVEQWRVRTTVPFHETLIRNEIAYYCTIGQKLCYAGGNDSVVVRTPEVPSSKAPASQQPLYLLGDSHTLSPGWMAVQVRGVSRLIVPKLATGVKQWHLRAESDFYPKANFQNVISTIPDGAEVIVVIGEIDCREGMLVAVERDNYETLPQAMETTIGLFVKDVLSVLVKKRKFKIYIHPVVPVLNETRHLVKAYNAIFQRACAQIPGVQWLDFFDDMLTDGIPPMLKDRYKMDGTHLNPAYVELIERSLNQL